jgi:hypothetical protein
MGDVTPRRNGASGKPAVRSVPYEPLELPPEERARRLARLEDEHYELHEFGTVDDERRFGHAPPAWVLEIREAGRR